MPEHARPDEWRNVWLTRGQRDLLYEIDGTGWDLRFAVKAWDAAPADPAKAVLGVFKTYEPDFDWPGKERGLPMLERPKFNALWRKGCADAVLRALGHPTNNPTSGGTHE